MIKKQNQHFYRTEIDGLRALAVIAVIINHLNKTTLPGGYLGVDVFFVISGYVVTSSLVNKEITNVKNFFLDFYARRFRRLLPALSIVLIVSSLLGCLFIYPYGYELQVSLRTAISSFFGLSNLYLLRQNLNYFSDNADYNLFTHTWSLGVEEQFYFVFPILLILSWKICGKKFNYHKMIPIILLPTITSFILYIYVFSFSGQSKAFFLMPTRFWQMGLGALCYLVIYFVQDKVHSKKISSSISLISLLGVIISFFSPLEWQLWMTITTSFLASILILSISSSTPTFKFLTLPYLRFIGLFSYSLYLWHWPFIVLARWTIGVNIISSTILLLLMGLSTALTYPIENYFRKKNQFFQEAIKPWKIVLTFMTIISLLAAFLFFVDVKLKYFLFTGNKDIAQNIPTNILSIYGTSINSVNCFQNPDVPIDSSSFDKFCAPKIKNTAPTFYFIGDSHTHVLIPLAEQVLKQSNVNVGVFSRGGCAFPYFSSASKLVDRGERYQLCPTFSEERAKFFQANVLPDDVIIVSNFLAGFFNDSDRQELELYKAQISSFVKKMSDKKAKVILISPFPLFDSTNEPVSPALCVKEWFRPNAYKNKGCQPIYANREKLINKINPIVEMLHQVESKNENSYVFNPFPMICPPKDKFCSNFRDNYQLFLDNNHISSFTSKELTPNFLLFLKHKSIIK